MKKYPLVSILIINYNGRNLLSDCLNSLAKINYPKASFEIIVVDNDSQDDSITYVKKHFPSVKLIESKTNLGFAGGNNLAYEHATGEYIVLLNNDTTVDPDWLIKLVETAKKESVGIVSSKLLFDIPFIELKINTPTEVKSNIYIESQEYSPYGIIVDEINCNVEEKNYYIWYKRGFYEPIPGNYSSRWTDGHGVVLLPFMDSESESYKISIHGHPHTFNSKTKFEIKIADKVVASGSINSREVKQINFTIERKDIEKNLIYLVQNAGNTLFKNGLGRDRGSVIKRAPSETREFYDYDSNYYNKEKQLVSMCGASCLIKRKTIDTTYLFDPAYFMYYEDVDLSLKIWRKGFDIVYQPKSVVYHKHRASTNKQTTVFFLSNVEKNHLFFLLTHFPLKIFLIQFVIFYIKYLTALTIIFLFEYLHYYGRTHKEYSVKLEARSIALRKFKESFTRIYAIRKELEKSERRGFAKLHSKLY